MKLSFENLGAIAKGEMELADLTIVCGQNNTGKTYVTYALYCLLKSWISLTRIDLSEEMKELTSEGVVKIDIEAKIVNAWPKISKAVIDNFLDAFPAMMASRSELFENTKRHWDIFIGDEWKKRAIKNELRSPQGSLLIAITKPADSVFAEIAAASPQSRGFLQGYSISEFIEEALIRIVLTDVMPDVFMASTERTGATIFRKDLNLAKNSVVDLLAQLHKDGTSDINPGKVFATLYQRNYARPVDDNVRFANNLPGTDSELSEIARTKPELLDQFGEIVGGSYVTTKDGVTFFQPAGTKLKLGLGETSSAVRSLLIIWYWLKYQAKSGSMLMIDEPELNLHPDNQRRFARFLAQLVNTGIRVFITTHSDTIVREFNTLIMLSRNLSHYAQVKQQYHYSENEHLKPSSVLLYITGKESNRKRALIALHKVIPDPKIGIDVETFDQTIIDMSSMQDELRYGGE